MNQASKLELYLKEIKMPLIKLFEKMIIRGDGVSYNTLWKIKHDRVNPKVSTVKSIAEALDVDIEKIF